MLDESEVIKWGVEAFKQANASYEEYETQHPGRWQKFPISYTIYGASFYRWGFRKGISVAPDCINPYDPCNPHHQQGMRIAFWINTQLDLFEGVMNIGADGDVQEYLADDKEHLIQTYNEILSIQENPLYPYLSEWYLRQLAIAKAAYTKRCAGYIKAQKLEAMRSSPRYGFIYLLESTVGYWKIGRSAVPVQRIGKLGVQLPFEIDVEALIETADMYELESGLHKKYEKKRVRGEWFNLDTEDIAYIKSLAVQSW